MEQKKPQKTNIDFKDLKKIKIEDALTKILSVQIIQIKIGLQVNTINL